MRWLAYVAVVMVAACATDGNGTTQVGTQPSWRHPVPQDSSATFAADGAPAARYNEPVVAPPHTPLNDAVTAAVGSAAVANNVPVPVADARLFRACDDLAKVVPEEGVVGYTTVEFALQRNGIVEPSPHLLVVWGDIDSPGDVVAQLQPRLAELLGDGTIARLGVGIARRKTKDGNGAVVFAMQASWLTTSPVPRVVPAGGSFTLDATVSSKFHDPEVFVTHDDDGSTERLPLAIGRAGEFTTALGCKSHGGRQQVEVTGTGVTGSTVLANFPIYCGAEPPETIPIAPTDDAPVVDNADAERRLLALVNRDRQAAGLPTLVWDDQLAAVARAHSDEMRRTKIVAHISPTTGSAADRVKAAGLKTGVVLENVARAYGVAEAHDGLMNSPGHRTNIMSTSATHIGIGVVLGDDVAGRREMFLTQLFIRRPPHIDTLRAADEVRGKLAAVRPDLNNTADLTSMAQQLADALASGQTRDQAWPAVKKRADLLGRRYSRIGSVVTTVGDLANVDGKILLGDAHPSDAGVGVAQGPHPEIGDNAIWIVVILADK